MNRNDPCGFYMCIRGIIQIKKRILGFRNETWFTESESEPIENFSQPKSEKYLSRTTTEKSELAQISTL